MGWFVFWSLWIGAGLAAEFRSISNEGPQDTLTEFARLFVLKTVWGSATIGAFLTWLLWHWLFVGSGVSESDLLAIAAGALIGVVGWAVRSPS